VQVQVQADKASKSSMLFGTADIQTAMQVATVIEKPPQDQGD